MMRSILLSFSVWFCVLQFAVGQARLGRSPQEIWNEFKPMYVTADDFTENGTYIIHVSFDNLTAGYAFDKNREYCNWIMFVPNNQRVLNGLVENYNQNYTILSPTQWRMYTNSGVANIELHFDDNGAFFIWTLLE